MSIYKMEGKKNGQQKYRVRVNYTDDYGKYKQLDRIVYGLENAKEVERKYQDEPPHTKLGGKTLNELYQEYIEVKKYEVRETTLEKTKQILNKYVLQFLGKCNIKKLTVPQLAKWKISIEELKLGNGKPLLLKTKQNIYKEFHALLNFGVKMEYIENNTLDKVGIFKDAYSIKKEMNFYTLEEFKTYIKVIQDIAEENEKLNLDMYEWNYYVFFMIAFYTGMRKGEINALQWNDIEENIIHVKKSITQKLKGEDRETPPKNKKSVRDVEMPKVLVQTLLKHYDRYKNVIGFNNDWRICGGEKCLRDTTTDTHNRKYAQKAGLKTIRIHDFRHSHASLLINKGVDIQEVSRRLGHTNTKITWDTYSHLYPDEKRRAIDALNTCW